MTINSLMSICGNCYVILQIYWWIQLYWCIDLFSLSIFVYSWKTVINCNYHLIISQTYIRAAMPVTFLKHVCLSSSTLDLVSLQSVSVSQPFSFPFLFHYHSLFLSPSLPLLVWQLHLFLVLSSSLIILCCWEGDENERYKMALFLFWSC